MCGVDVDNVDDCMLDCCVEMALITLVAPLTVMPLFVDTITGFVLFTGDDVFGMIVVVDDFCGKFDSVLYSIIELPLGLR